jgi:hypothetical protein
MQLRTKLFSMQQQVVLAESSRHSDRTAKQLPHSVCKKSDGRREPQVKDFSNDCGMLHWRHVCLLHVCDFHNPAKQQTIIMSDVT